jgi:NAD(P)H-hydrate epimerase
MFLSAGDQYVTRFTFPEDANALGIGPGLGLEEGTKRAFTQFLEACSRPIILDADALNIISENKILLHQIPAQSILSPHPGEFERLFGTSINSMARAELARNQAMKYNIIIILKGHYSMVFLPDGECWYNPTGNAGMATAGSGDVLTGILTGFMAQGYSPKEAAISGTYLHGLAGDLAAKNHSEEALIATDLIDYLGKAFLKIQSSC